TSSDEGERMVRVGLDVKASVVIYFKVGITGEQIEDFAARFLRGRITERGTPLRAGICEYLRLFPLQSHDAVAIQFCEAADEQTRKAIKADITSSPIVFKILENIVPLDVKNIN